ncbi:hypothetical protein BDZ45DRAFT_672548 [Acephala macrosclerotiorum]|nr:hypothetical protein BDZ45DRAFT_672548 [Acephala macrosclerotiorum]
MGCGGSKPVQQPVETNIRTQTRQKTAARPSGTARQPSSHHQSRSGHPPSSRNRTRHRTANRPQIRLTPLEEQPEDVAISDAVRDLAAIIEGHSRNYYPRTNAFAVGKEIGRSIVNYAIMGDDNEISTV